MSALARTFIVLVTLLAIAFAVTIDLPGYIWLATLTGLLMIFAPPRGPLPRVPILLAGLLIAISLLAFLPGGSAEGAAWRTYLLTECHISPAIGPYAFPLANTLTPQPWLTLQSCAMLFIDLAWGLYLLALPWEREDRVQVAEVLTFGVAFLALLASLAFLLQFHVPGWYQAENRGFFPNRNQTADVLAVCGIVAYALIFDRLRKGKRIGYFLLGAIVPIFAGLIISYSRAGIILFFGGVMAWHCWPHPKAVADKGVGSYKWVALSAALGVALLAIFLAFGGETLSRFQGSTATGAFAADSTHFRMAIQKDAFHFSLQSPLVGTGLANFEPLFSFSRVEAINNNRAIHPESDWLFFASEMGWPAVCVLFLGYAWWLRRVLPFTTRQGESMRRALVVAPLIFGVHGLVDVSGHCAAPLFVALLLAAMALPSPIDTRPSFSTPLFFRVLGCLVLAIAGWWKGSQYSLPLPPTSFTLARMQQSLASNKLDPAAAVKTAGDALQIAPLDWLSYFQRGMGELSLSVTAKTTVDQSKQLEAARRDFATARALNPFYLALALEEGDAFAANNEQDLGLEAWTDSLHRAGPMAPQMYHDMVGDAPPHSILREGLAELAFKDTGYLLTILPSSPPDEAEALIGNLLQGDPNLGGFTPAQRDQLFDAWWKQGNVTQMMQVIHDHPEWDPQTWPYQARYAAKENDFHGACDIVTHWVKAPMIPKNTTNTPLSALVVEFQENPTSLPDGLMLALAQMEGGQTGDALTTLDALMKMPDHPRYLPYLQAQLYAGKKDWQSAWGAWENYLQP